MDYKFDVPKRLLKKKGLFGTLENKDIGLTVLLLVIAFTSMLMLGIVGIIIAAVCGLCILLLVVPDKYGENGRIHIGRFMKYSKSQKIYYYYRGTK